MAANEYRSYLRSPSDMEDAPERVPHTGSTQRALVLVTLTVMGLLQVASSVAILLHLTGHLREVDLVPAQQRFHEEMHSETLKADPRKRSRLKKNTLQMPSAHLPIKAPIDFKNSVSAEDVTIHWDKSQGTLKKINYNNGRILVESPGHYYVYAKTCFRYYENFSDTMDVSHLQFIQYIYHKSSTQPNAKPVELTKSGEVLQWNKTKYSMYCVEQSRGVHLNTDDALYVNVSNVKLLDPDGHGTFFGAFKTSD